MFKRSFFGLVFIFLLAGLSWAQQPWQQPGMIPQPGPIMQPWWYTLERGKLHFRSGAYGDALMAFEEELGLL